MSETHEQFKSLTLSKGRGDDYCIAKRQLESLTATKVHDDRSQAINKHFILLT
jgi:hypothetical protein